MPRSARSQVARSFALAGTLVLAHAALGSVSFSDSTFANADWSIPAYSFTGSALAPTGAQVATGGNTGSYRRVDHNSFSSQMISYHLRSGATYDPASSGAITSIAFNIDAMAITNHAGVNVGVSLVVKQGSFYYYTPSSAKFVLNNSASWASFTRSLVQADFGRFGAPASQPDFSASGAPMQFGLAFLNDNGGFTTSRAVGVDNWGVTIVPSPGAAWALLLGGAAWARRRR